MLEIIFQNAPPDTFVEITYLPSDRRYANPAVALSGDLNGRGETDLFFGPALRKSRGSAREDIFGTRVLWVDIDRTAQPYSTFTPSIVVHSGGGWHLYWLLDDWCTDINAIEEANKALMEDTDADHCWNANRLLRLPGTRNSKYADTTCELRQLRAHITYTLQDFVALAKIDSKARHKIRTGDRRGYKSRSERDWSIIESLVTAGASDSLIRTIFITQPCGDKFRDPDTNAEQYLSHTVEQVREKSQSVRVMRRTTVGDITETDDGYFVDRARGRHRLSTFVFTPTLLLESDKEDVLVGSVKASGYTWNDIKFPRSAFNGRKEFDKHLTTAAWVWLGRDDDVRSLLPYLLKQIQDKGLPRSRSTAVLGRHDGIFVGTKQSIDTTQVYEGVDSPLSFLHPNKELPQICYTDGPMPDLSNVFQINTIPAICSSLGWFMATPFKPLLEARGINVRFPILNVYGTRGSGKTTLIRTFQRLLGYEKTIAYDCNTTRFVILSLLGSSNAVPVAFSEFRQSVADKFIRFVLLSYDTGHDPRGRADQSTIDYPLSAPFTVDGEDIIGDAACKERILAINLHPESIAEGTPAYNAFGVLRGQPLENFALPYIKHTLTIDVGAIADEARQQIMEAFPETLPDRVRNNIIVSYIGLLTFTRFTGIPLPAVLRDIYDPVLHSVWSPLMGRSVTLADDFCESIANAVAMKKGEFFNHVENGVLWFQLATAMQWWMRIRRVSGQNTLERDAIRSQLLERSSNLGDKGQYVVAPKVVQGRWCYGIDLKSAHDSGLDVPDSIDSTKSVTIQF